MKNYVYKYINKKLLIIHKNKTWKIKRWVYIKIFNLERQDIHLVVFAKFIYKNIFLFKQTIIKIETN